jgi:hypothetical protein
MSNPTDFPELTYGGPGTRRHAREQERLMMGRRKTASGRRGARKPSSAAARVDRRKRKLNPHVIPWIVVVLAVLVVGIGWIGFRAYNVVSAMKDAQAQLSSFKSNATSVNTAALKPTAQRLTDDTDKAAKNANDPVWRAAEYIPGLGGNLRVVRQLADASRDLSHGVVAPAVAALGSVDIKTLRTADGGIDLEQLVPLSTAMPGIASSYDDVAKQVADVSTKGTFSPVSDAWQQLNSTLTGQKGLVDGLKKYMPLTLTALGEQGQRNYIVVFPNEAETTALGGTAASMLQISFDHGKLTLGRQATSSDFHWQDGTPIIPPAASAQRIFSPLIYTRSNLALARPDFPTGAQMIDAYWKQYFGGQIDGVISLDPTTLSYILGATGPVTLANGDKLSQGNFVSTMLNGAYLKLAKPTINETEQATNAYFGMATMSIFDHLIHTNASPTSLVRALGKGVGERRVMMWFSNAGEQKQLGDATIAGVLPTSNAKSTVTGVYFRDESASKMDYYLKTTAKQVANVCTPVPTFTTSITMKNDISPAAFAQLPIFVAPQEGTQRNVTTHAAFYGPIGAKAGTITVQMGGRVLEKKYIHVDDDLGRPVVWFDIDLDADQEASATVEFEGTNSRYGSPALVTTPMIHPTEVHVSAPRCGK